MTSRFSGATPPDSKLSVDSISSKVRSDIAPLSALQLLERTTMDREHTFDLQRHQLDSGVGEPTLSMGELDGGRDNGLPSNGVNHIPSNGMGYGAQSPTDERPHNFLNGRSYLADNALGDDDIHGSGSINDSMSISKRSAVSASGSLSKFADFFGAEIFQIVLHNPSTAHQLTKFSQSRFCGENMEFLEKVHKYDELINELNKTMAEIHRSFISINAPSQINLSQTVMKKLNQNIRKAITSNLPVMESIFVEAQENVETLVATDIYPRFVRYQMTMSATRALASDKGKYGGLGDCFCLTNPAKADNPIISASDGFVKVTGYSRSDIIPRNCRFLQGQHTDRVPIRRLRNAIRNREESVELLLNYKKNGEPFWNLLYCTPLFNAEGNVVFFLGGQINCSTTIHNCSDVLRILSQSEDVEDEKEELPPARPATKLGFFKSLRSPSRNTTANGREAGMEQGLLNRIEKMNLKGQMNTFYTAYSKYLVMSYDNLLIRFYSTGILDMLNPTNLADSPIVGTDIFKFLGHHATSVTKDYKSKVRAALRLGQAISVDIHVSTRRSAMFRGDERFSTHWTPLKDDHAITTFVVMTMAAEFNRGSGRNPSRPESLSSDIIPETLALFILSKLRGASVSAVPDSPLDVALKRALMISEEERARDWSRAALDMVKL